MNLKYLCKCTKYRVPSINAVSSLILTSTHQWCGIFYTTPYTCAISHPKGSDICSRKKWSLLSGCYIYKPVLACGTFPLAFPIFMLKSCLIIKAYLKWHHLCPEKFPVTPTPCDSAALQFFIGPYLSHASYIPLKEKTMSYAKLQSYSFYIMFCISLMVRVSL